MAGIIACANVESYASDMTDSSDNAITLSISDCANNIKAIYTELYPEAENEITEMVDTITNNEVFAEIFEQEGTSAFQIVDRSLNDYFNPSVKGCMQTDDMYISSHSFPNVQQKNSYYCGPAAILMSLIGSGASGYYYTNNETITDSWQDTVANAIGTTSSGSNITNIKNYLNQRVTGSNGYSFSTMIFTRYTYNTVLDYIEESLIMDTVPILLLTPRSNLGYYNGNTPSHYVVVESVDFNAGTVTIIDPHYSNTYFGSHVITTDELVTVAKNSQDLWAVVYTK